MTRRTQAAIALAAALLATGVGGGVWAIATGRISPSTWTLRTLAILGTLSLAEWAYNLARAIHDHRHR